MVGRSIIEEHDISYRLETLGRRVKVVELKEKKNRATKESV